MSGNWTKTYDVENKNPDELAIKETQQNMKSDPLKQIEKKSTDKMKKI